MDEYNINVKNRMRERGQTLVILVISLTAFLAFLALALDGGNTWAQRRKAQTAADAGALAGARQMCASEGTDSEKTAAAVAGAQDYAVVRNGATSADVTTSLTPAWVEVTTHVVFNTFFAHLLGTPVIDAQATARAACFTPSTGEGVLPIAWSCKPPLDEESASEDCELYTMSLEEFNDISPWQVLYPEYELYLIMDNESFEDDLYCLPDPGGIDCDLDGDGDIDVIGRGDRSWLDLNGGGGGANELRDWIEDGYAPELEIHTWIPDQTGTANSIFQSAATRVGDVVTLPVFDMFCQGDISGGDCATLVHTSPISDTVVYGSGHSMYVHLASFAGFGISCVKSPGVAGTCPGWEAFQEVNEGDPRINNSFRSIEGYFIHGFVPGVGGGEPGPPDAGVYVLLLTK